MFISFKDIPVIATLEEYSPYLEENPFYNQYTGYSFSAESININVSKNANFYFQNNSLKDFGPFKTNDGSRSSQGGVTTIDISYYMSVPEEAMFFIATCPPFRDETNNNCAKIYNEAHHSKDLYNEVMKKYNLIFGSGIFRQSYLKSYSFEVTPNNIIKNNISFVTYSPFSGFNSNITNYLKTKGVGNIYKIDSTKNKSSNWCPAESFNFKLYEKYIPTGNPIEIKILDSESGNLLRYNYSYKADIQPVYRATERYPYRVIYNQEEITMDIDIDYQDLYINDPLYYNYTSELKIKNLLDATLEVPKEGSQSWTAGNQYFGCAFKMQSGTLFNMQASAKTNDIMNNRFSLKYYV